MKKCKDCGGECASKAQRCKPCSAENSRIVKAQYDRERKAKMKETDTGQLSRGCNRRQNKRQAVKPVTNEKWRVQIGKTTFYPRTEKRYLELLKIKNNE